VNDRYAATPFSAMYLGSQELFSLLHAASRVLHNCGIQMWFLCL